jgi:SAM-dependent methyltransferase
MNLASVRALLGGIVGTWCYCVVCDRKVPAFLPWKGGWAAAPPLMRTLRLVGSDLDRFACPRCRSTDRDRHLRLYLQRTVAESFRGARILHFAPEAAMVPWLAGFSPALHVQADLFPLRPEIQRMDLEAIPFDDGSFDWVIANHVLEHVGDLDKAVSEIARVLAPGGRAILQTPWAKGIARTIDDPTVTDEQSRLQLYGQKDHVRLFGRDVYDRIGLRAVPMKHSDVLPDIDTHAYGVNPDEDLMLFEA